MSPFTNFTLDDFIIFSRYFLFPAYVNLSNIIIASEAVAKSALIREDSRGGHTRIDFPDETKKGLE